MHGCALHCVVHCSVVHPTKECCTSTFNTGQQCSGSISQGLAILAVAHIFKMVSVYPSIFKKEKLDRSIDLAVQPIYLPIGNPCSGTTVSSHTVIQYSSQFHLTAFSKMVPSQFIQLSFEASKNQL